MSDVDEPRPGPADPTGPGDGPAGDPTPGAGEPVGSVGEEAARLFGVLSDWAQDQGGAFGGWPGHASSDAGHLAGEHAATGGADCRWCPVCQLVGVVRQTSPEVRQHLAAAAGSMVQAVGALLATTPPGPGRPVERIDLDDESVWDEREWDGKR